jgi:hypothetical protein
MALIDELKEMREAAKKREQERRSEAFEMQTWADVDAKYVRELDRAIAALEPAPIPEPEPETQTGEGVEIPEGFTKWEGGEWTGNSRDIVQVIFHDEPTPYFPERADRLSPLWNWSECKPDFQRIIAYRIIEPAPTPEDEPDDASEFAESEAESPTLTIAELLAEADESIRAAAIELTADVEPWPEVWPEGIEGDQETCEPLPQPEWNEPQPTEGYAPVTDPEADALAKASEYYDPKAVADRNRFNPWGGVSHLFGKPKVDA